MEINENPYRSSVRNAFSSYLILSNYYLGILGSHYSSTTNSHSYHFEILIMNITVKEKIHNTETLEFLIVICH